MSKEGYWKWNKYRKANIRPIIYKPRPHLTRLPATTDTKEKLAQWLFDNFGLGYWTIQTFGKAYTKTGIGFKKSTRIELTPIQDPTGERPYNAIYHDLRAISHYWFWKTE